MGLKRWYMFLFILLFCICGVALSKITCTPGLSMPGYTIPQGDILIEYGNPLDITCVVVANGTQNNASLSFKRNRETLPPEMIDVINATAIKLHFEKPPLATGDTYTCLLKTETNVCMNRVTVGTKPQTVEDFKCIGYNYDNLTCTWTAPQNYIVTKYNLTYTLGEGRSSRYQFVCPQKLDTPDVDNQMSCFWNVSTTPPYRPVHEKYNFTLIMENKFGRNQINELFNHWAHVLPGPPENLTALSVTSSSIHLYWQVPFSMQSFPPGVHHRILYQCEYGEKKWQDGGVIGDKSLKRKQVHYNLPNLKYAHALCDIRVSLRSAQSLPDDEFMWSRNSSITVRTGSKIPDRPPETNVGSFEIVAFGNRLQYREAYIYWKQISEVEKNGPDFKYNIAVDEDDSIKPIDITNSYAKFKDLLISKSYTFSIWSENSNGSSIHKSTVFIPKQTDRVKEPMSFTKVEFSEGEFELTWEAPKLASNQYITNYTIFSCSNERDRPYQCNGMLNWTVVPNDATSINMRVDRHKIFQFAISANTQNSSSGMLWAGCTVIHNKNMGKLKNVWINRVGSTFIEVGWKLDCSDRIGSVEGYIIYYCPIKSPMHTQCKAPQANSTFNGTNVSGGNITNLNPYTTYMLTVSVRTKHTTFSQQSDPLYNTTLEAAPTPPIDLKVSKVTNSSITVVWKQPEAINGVLRYYDVEYVHRTKTYSLKSEQTIYTFSNLSSYENYSISVAACTVMCSTQAEVTVSTKMGHASKIRKPTVDRRNDTSITIVWNRPLQPGGKNDYYIVRLKQQYKNGNKTFEYNTTARKYVIDNCGDGGKYNTFYVSVKAVNKIEGKVYDDGFWSDELENYCYTPINYIMYLLLILVIAALISIGFLFTRLYHRCKIMRDVEVKLPPGLAPVVADHTLVPWSTEKHQENRTSHHSPPDEELLLVKMSEGRDFSGDSSGCSSGHESVNSSLESGTRIPGSSDSGTEQPGNYCALGVNPKVVVDSSYIPVTAEAVKLPFKTTYDDSNESSPYVLSGDAAVKSINPGYIPFNQNEPIEKSSGYVVAGIKNINGYIPFNQTETVNRNTGYVQAGIKNFKVD